MWTIRPEQGDDEAAVRAVHRAAFPTDAEARLVDRLRSTGQARVSLVAEAAGAVVGHILFSPVSVVGTVTAASEIDGTLADGASLGVAEPPVVGSVESASPMAAGARSSSGRVASTAASASSSGSISRR